MGESYIQRADQASLRKVFNKYASVRDQGESFLTYEDFIVRQEVEEWTLKHLSIRFLGLLPPDGYSRETLALYGGILDQGKDGSGLISFQEFAAFESHLCRPDALYRAAFQLFDRSKGTTDSA